MPSIRNSELIKKFTDFFRLKSNDFLDSEAGRMLLPVITHPILPTIVMFRPTEAEWSTGIRVPSGKKWKIISVHILWTSDVTAGNREITMRIRTGDLLNNLFLGASRNFQSASLATHYSFTLGGQNVGSASSLSQSIGLPQDLVLTENVRIRIFDDTNVSAGDTLTESTLVVEEETLIEDEFDDRAI